MRNASSTAAAGHANVAIGVYPLYGNTGNYNIGIGYKAMAGYGIDSSSSVAPITGSSNVAIGGFYTMANLISGSNNVAVGDTALQLNTTANSNTAIGAYTLRYSNGAGNTALGYYAGYSDTPDGRSTIDTYMTFLGTIAGRSTAVASTTALTNSTAIGYGATVSASNQVVLGNSSVTLILS